MDDLDELAARADVIAASLRDAAELGDDDVPADLPAGGEDVHVGGVQDGPVSDRTAPP